MTYLFDLVLGSSWCAVVTQSQFIKSHPSQVSRKAILFAISCTVRLLMLNAGYLAHSLADHRFLATTQCAKKAISPTSDRCFITNSNTIKISPKKNGFILHQILLMLTKPNHLLMFHTTHPFQCQRCFWRGKKQMVIELPTNRRQKAAQRKCFNPISAKFWQMKKFWQTERLSSCNLYIIFEHQAIHWHNNNNNKLQNKH